MTPIHDHSTKVTRCVVLLINLVIIKTCVHVALLFFSRVICGISVYKH